MRKPNHEGCTIAVLFYDYSIISGGHRVATNVFNDVCNKGFRVIFLSVFMSRDTKLFALDEKIDFYYLNIGSGHFYKSIAKTTRRIKRIIEDNNVDLIVANGFSADFLAVFVSQTFKIPMIHWEHTSLENKFFNDGLVSRIYRFLGAKFADKIVVLTEGNRISFIKHYHLKPEKIVVVPNWVEKKDGIKRYNEDSHIIISIGRADPVKGFDRLIEIARLVQNEAWQWQIWGDFDNTYGKELAKIISSKGLSNFVRLMGVTNAVQDVYRKSSFLVLTSYYEGLPMVLLEAKQNDVPLISFDIKTGPNEIITDGINGYLVQDHDIEGMVEKIKDLMNNKEKRVYFSQNSYIGLEKFDKDTILEQWMNMLNELIKQTRKET